MNRKKWYIILAAVSLLAVISTLIIFPKVQNASNTDRADLPLAASGSYTLPAYFEVTKASSGNNAVWHSEPSGSKGTKGSISVGTRITVVDNKKNDKGNWWYKYKDGNGYKWIYGDYITYRGSISSYSATMETKNGGKNWTQPWSNDTSRYTSSGSYGNGRVIKVTEKINRNGTVWYKVSDGRFIYSDNVKTHTCSSTVISKSNYKSINSSQHSYSYTERKCSNSTCPNYSVTNTYSGKENHSYSNGICTKCNDWKAKSTRAVNNVKYVVTESNVKVHSGPYGACSTTCYLSKGDTITVTMSVENYEGHTWYKYSGGYIYSDYVKEHSSCTWDSGVYTKKPTCTEGGTKKYTCTLCGATKTGSVKALGHTKDNVCTRCGYWSKDSLKSTTKINNVKYVVYKDGAKIHSGPYGATPTVSSPANKTALVATQKIVNGEGHVWYEVDGGYIYSDYVKEHSSCTWDKGVYTKKPTCTEGGTKKYTCTLCGATKTGSVKALGHTKDNVCTRCGYWSKDSLKSTTKINNVKYVVYKDGAKIHSGPYGATPTVSSPANKTVLTVTQKVVNGEKHIWYKVDGGYIYSDYVKEHSSCTWDSGVYTKKPTCTEGGKKKYTCILCDATKTGTVKALGHKYNKNGICERCSAWDKKSLKSTSSVASVKYVVIKDNAVVHEGPYGACKTTAKLNKETVITVTQKVANSYNKTWYKCSEGYIYADYVQTYDLYYATISLNTSSTTVYKGFTQELKAKVKGPSKKVTWSSSDKNVATVSADGVVTGKKAGICIITAKANGKKATCTITVKNPSIKLKSKVTVYTYGTKPLTATVNGPSSKVTWKSSDTKIATVNKSGVVTPKKTGTCKITATANGVSATCTITVKKPSLKLESGTFTLYCNQEVKLKAIVKGNDTTVKWSSSNPSVATVDSKGVVTASNNESADGKRCIITAKSNGLKATCTIVVKFDKNISYQNVDFIISKVPGSTELVYKSDWFKKDSLTYNHNIAKLASQLVMLGYDENKAVKGAIERMGFEDVVFENDTKRNEVNYYMAHRVIQINGKSYNLLIVGCIGSHYHQWYSNFDPLGEVRKKDGTYLRGDGKVHLGFADARDFVYEKMEAYIGKLNSNLETKVFITGHSRGAAAANLLGAQLILSQKIGNISLNRSNIFTYTFATPNVAYKDYIEEQTKSVGMYDRIFNIVNSEDFVTMVLPEAWGYTKYGITYNLPKSTDKNYKNYLSAMRKEFAVLSTTKKYNPYPDGISLVSDTIKLMTSKVKSVDEMYSKKFYSYASVNKISVYEFFKVALCPIVVTPKKNKVDERKNEAAIAIMLDHVIQDINAPDASDIVNPYYFYNKIAVFFAKSEGAGVFADKVKLDGLIGTYFSDAHISQTYCAYMLSLDADTLKALNK